MASLVQVVLEARDDPGTVEAELFESFAKVVQIAPLAALQERSQFGPEKFLRFERYDLRPGLVPVADKLERIGPEAKEAERRSCPSVSAR